MSHEKPSSFKRRQLIKEAGLRVIANTREEFADVIRKDVVLWKSMVQTTGFKV